MKITILISTSGRNWLHVMLEKIMNLKEEIRMSKNY